MLPKKSTATALVSTSRTRHTSPAPRSSVVAPRKFISPRQDQPGGASHTPGRTPPSCPTTGKKKKTISSLSSRIRPRALLETSLGINTSPRFLPSRTSIRRKSSDLPSASVYREPNKWKLPVISDAGSDATDVGELLGADTSPTKETVEEEQARVLMTKLEKSVNKLNEIEKESTKGDACRSEAVYAEMKARADSFAALSPGFMQQTKNIHNALVDASAVAQSSATNLRTTLEKSFTSMTSKLEQLEALFQQRAQERQRFRDRIETLRNEHDAWLTNAAASFTATRSDIEGEVVEMIEKRSKGDPDLRRSLRFLLENF